MKFSNFFLILQFGLYQRNRNKALFHALRARDGAGGLCQSTGRPGGIRRAGTGRLDREVVGDDNKYRLIQQKKQNFENF